MPVSASLTGTLTRVAAGGSAAAGTFSVVGYAENPAVGTLAVDRTLFLAFYSRVRLTRPDVFVAGALMANLVDTVEIDESIDDPIAYATFTLSDKRVAFLDPDSFSNGERSVEVDLWCGPPVSVLLWEYAFVGDTETSQNSMPYRPRGTFKAVSRAAKWANVNGCLEVPAMSGLTSGELVAALGESAGVTIIGAVELGGVRHRKKLVINDTPFNFIKAIGEIEGWIVRPIRLPFDDNGSGMGLEVISEDRALDGAPVFEFDESNSFDVPETTPDRPVTDWILSATQIATGPVAAAASSGGGSVATGVTVGAGGGGASIPPRPPTLLTSTGGSPGITGTINGTNVTFTTSVDASVALAVIPSSRGLVYVDGMPDFAATWTGTTLVTSSGPTTSVRLMYWR